MRIKPPQTVSNLKDLDQVVRYTAQTLDLLVTEINGRLVFGENIRGQLLSVTFSSSNTNTTVPHTLGRAPEGYILTGANAAMGLYDGTLPNDTKNAYLRSSSAGVARIFLF